MNYNQITQKSAESGDNIENDLLNLDQMKGLSVMRWTPKVASLPELQFISLGLHLTVWHHILQPVLCSLGQYAALEQSYGKWEYTLI